jgi:hypothetical protein
MKRMLVLLLVGPFFGCGASLSGPAAGGPSGDTSFSRAAQVSEPMLPCSGATHAAVDAVRRMGYTVTDVKRATPEAPGMVTGVRELGYSAADPVAGEKNTMKVRVTCSDAGSSFEAVSDEGGLAQLNFASRFSSVVKKEVATKKVRQTKPAEEARGLVLTMEPQRSGDSMAAFGIDLPAAGITPVKVEINNRSDRRYLFEADRVTLVTMQGKRQKALSADAAAAQAGAGALAAKLKQSTLEEGEIAPGGTRSGYLFFPASTYGSARVVLKDIESDEPEGFSIGF